MEDVWWEYGYRTPEGEDVWAVDHGGDGEWTPARPELGMPSIDITYDEGGKAVHRKIYEAMDRAGLAGVVITRRVSRGVSEEVERPSGM